MRRSIRTRLLISYIALAIIPLLGVGIFVTGRSFTVLTDEAFRSQHQQAVTVSTQIVAFIAGLEDQLHLLIQVQGIADLSYEQQKSVLTALESYQNNFEEVALINSTGQEQVRVSRTNVSTQADLADRSKTAEFLTPISTGKVYYGPVRINSTNLEPLMSVAVPIVNLRSGQVDSVLVAVIRFKPIWDLVANLDLGDNSTVYVLDTQKQVVAHPDPSVTLKGTHFAPLDQNGIQQGLSGTQVILSTNQIQFGDQEFTVVAEKPAVDALAPSINAVIFTVAVIVVALFLAIAIGYLAVRQIVRPVLSLASTAQIIMAGDLSKQAEVTSDDEIGLLAKAFNQMTGQLRQKIRELDHRIEELNRANDELKIATAKAREAARVKGEFLSNMSHELRTPLNAIIGFSDMLLAGMSDPLTDKQRHKMERLKENGTRLLTLINDLLDLTRIESGRLEMIQKPFSPQALADRMTAQMESLAVVGHLKVEAKVGLDVPKTLIGDEKRIEQIVVNLLSNAFKFTKEGSVTLELSVNQTEHTWSLIVSDTGIGIPPHALNVIFEEFRQLDGSYSRAYKGSGLGLAITRNLVRMMSGKISVKSVLGSGSTFTVVLPMQPNQTADVSVLTAIAN